MSQRLGLRLDPVDPVFDQVAYRDEADHLALADHRQVADAAPGHQPERFERAGGVVAMGGYNTFCEILSFDKRAIIVPRTLTR